MPPSALVVEDDIATRTLLTVLLERSGFEVDAIGSGSDAVTLISSVTYSTVLLDLQLAGTSGHEILAFLEVHDPEMIPHSVVVSSTQPQELDRVRQRYPHTAVLRKPFDLQDLMEKVVRAAENRTQGARDLTAEFCRRSIVNGAKAGAVFVADSEADKLHLVRSFGYSAEMLDHFVPVDANAPFPACSAYRRGSPVWLNSTDVATSEYPELETVWRANHSHALAALPLMRDGKPFGAAGWSFRDSRPFVEEERHRFEAIATILSTELGALATV